MSRPRGHHLEEIVGRLDPIDLTELNARAALQTRADSKYVLDRAQFDAFVARLEGRCDVLEIDGVRGQQYDTTYFDSAQLTSYHDHLQRRRYTYKMRTRIYVDTGLNVFEVKLRDGRGHTVKRKIDHADDAANVVGPRADAFFREVVREAYGLDVTYPVQPVLRNRYRRFTLASRATPARTTVDVDLHMLRSADVVASMDPTLALVETKSAHGNGEMDRLLWDLGIRPMRVSKYCLGLELLHPHLSVNRYLPAMTRLFGPPRRPTVTAVGERAATAYVSLERPPRAPRPLRPPRAPRGPRPLHPVR
ncbi:polyphosphate polymerase domain-containing protein [Mobilicoccus massiliensis]|uniref:polyphosphate polymerase domain-containing protein n=1 Tax=Mobilicoccus massiliensis TaxID=1522310 RepID=UPI001596D256|nr:polyphosphate polymerase domain-containing protein [Mobilicoccus massiliensis]